MKSIAKYLVIVLAICAVAFCVGCGQTGVGGGASSAASGASQNASSGAAAGALADGEYEIDLSLEGGSGRATVASPAKLVVSKGAMTLTVVWSSPNYDLMVVDGKQYKPVNKSGNSTFEIPVKSVFEDLPVQAETTAMGTPHMIDYVLRFDAGEQFETAEATTTKQVADFHNADLGNGWQPVSAMDLQYAKCFSVDYYDGGYKLVCMSDGGRYLTVPEGAAAPEGIASDIVVINQPMSDLYLVASDTMCLFDALGALDRITVSGISQDNWYIPSAVDAMASGAMVYGGKYSAPDYELLLSKKVKLAIESTMINHTPSVREKLIELGIPVLVEMSSYESEPLGRTEWVKCYGALLNMEDQAQALFDEQVAQIASIDAADTGKTVAFFYINSNGAAVVRKPGDYVTKMIDQAGGDYAFNSLDDADDSMSTVTLEMERFYAIAKDADIIIYNSSIDGSVDSVDALVRKNALLNDFAAVKSGEVWATNQNMYQQMMQTGRIIADFNTAITGSGAETVYVHKLG